MADAPSQQPAIGVGDIVRFKHSPPLSGVVSSLDSDGAMVCMRIGTSYQLRGPVACEDLELEDDGPPPERDHDWEWVTYD